MCKRFKRRPIEPGFAAFTEDLRCICHTIVGYTLYGIYTVASPVLRWLKID